MYILLIIFITMIVILLMCIRSMVNKEYKELSLFAVVVIIIISILIGGIITDITSIKAIDVYRGNTELKITGEYRDSIFIPTDTIVIRKNK